LHSQFPWARNPNWSRFYSGSKEIWEYFKDVATKYDLEKYIKFEHKIKLAKWNEKKGVWELTVQAPDGSEFMDHCEILVNGSGVLK
jgi:cation diffusion facilitator CzcD-associated flavoprotein CzcO